MLSSLTNRVSGGNNIFRPKATLYKSYIDKKTVYIKHADAVEV